MGTTSFLCASSAHVKPIPQRCQMPLALFQKIVKCAVPGFQMPHPWDQETRKYLTGGGGQSGYCWN